mmetsp:Transcript_15372/g.18642  ORF Transcript_15372/g.18642 Transcript_15372/m.18642 type:complete len:399 (-) Transcript_15372:145-1341(-)
MYITVVGGGNSTAIFATQAKLAGHEVAILTRKPEKWSNPVGFENQDPEYLDGVTNFEATVDLITSDAAACIPQADMIFIAGLPIHFNYEILHKLAPHIDRQKRVYIGTVCAYGGFNWIVADVLGEGNYVIFGTQQIPWTCGTLEYGKRGVVFGKKASMRVATEDGKDEHDIKGMLGKILRLDTIQDADFLFSSLWPNNPLVHPPILYALFKDWDGKKVFQLGSPEAPEYIYAELNEQAAENIGKLSDEHVAIVKALSAANPDNEFLKLDYGYMPSLIYAYGDSIGDTSSIYKAIRSTPAYAKHKNPYVQVEGGVIPNVEHKFFTTDVSYGLCTYKDIALMLDVPTPLMDDIIYWNQKMINKEYLVDGKLTGKDCGECILPSRYGLNKTNLHMGMRKKE